MSSGKEENPELPCLHSDSNEFQLLGSEAAHILQNLNHAREANNSPVINPTVHDLKNQQESDTKNTSSEPFNDFTRLVSPYSKSEGEADTENSSPSIVDDLNNQKGNAKHTSSAVTDNSNSISQKIRNFKKPFFSPTPFEKMEVTKIDLFLQVFSAVTYVADIGTDIWVAVKHYQNDNIAWMGLTITFILLPCLMGMGLALMNGCCCGSMFGPFHNVPLMIPGGLFIMYVQNIRGGYKCMMRNNANASTYYIAHFTSTALVRFLEAYGEAAPQLILQFFIMVKDIRQTAPIQWASVISSLVSLSWAILSNYKTTNMIDKKPKMPHLGVVLFLGWHLCTVWARVLAFAICSVYSFYVFIGIAGFHFLASAIYLRLSVYSRGSLTEMLIATVTFSFVALISYFSIDRATTSRRQYLFFHTLMYVENVCMLLLWFFSPSSGFVPLWFRYLASVSIFAGYLFGVLLQIVYYVDFHPKNFDKDKTKCIKICISWKEWVKAMDPDAIEIRRWRQEITRWREEKIKDEEKMRRQEEEMRRQEEEICRHQEQIKHEDEIYRKKAGKITKQGKCLKDQEKIMSKRKKQKPIKLVKQEIKRWEDKKGRLNQEIERWKEEHTRWREERGVKQEEEGVERGGSEEEGKEEEGRQKGNVDNFF